MSELDFKHVLKMMNDMDFRYVLLFIPFFTIIVGLFKQKRSTIVFGVWLLVLAIFYIISSYLVDDSNLILWIVLFLMLLSTIIFEYLSHPKEISKKSGEMIIMVLCLVPVLVNIIESIGSYLKPSKPAEIKISSIIQKRKERKCVKPNPDFYFLGVVVYDYIEISDLDYVKNDKKLIYKLATCYMGVPKDNIIILENPSYAFLKKQLRKVAENINKKDAFFYFYYSGHGIVDSKGNFYILPADASIEDENILRESGINIDELKRLLARVRGKKVAFIDACRIRPPWKPAAVIYKPDLTKMAFIFSTKEGQISNVDKEKKYSAFTRALYEMATSGLFNVDIDDDGYVEIKELMGPLTKWLRRVSADSSQTPEAWGPDDFEIFPVD